MWDTLILILNAYYSLDSQRDFEDFCEGDIRQSRREPTGIWQRLRVDDDVAAGRPGSGVHIHSGRSGFKGLKLSFTKWKLED